MQIEITKITVILNKHGMDTVSLKTDLPPTVPPELSNDPCNLMFYCTKDTGEEYCKKNFPGVPIKIIYPL